MPSLQGFLVWGNGARLLYCLWRNHIAEVFGNKSHFKGKNHGFTRFPQIWQWLFQKTSVPAALQNGLFHVDMDVCIHFPWVCLLVRQLCIHCTVLWAPTDFLILHLEQWFSIFLVLRPFNTVPHPMVTPTIKLFSFLLHNFITAILLLLWIIM